MTRDEIAKRFETFFEWDTDDRSIVTSTSAKLFAEHIAGLAVAAEREVCAKICENEHEQRELHFEQTGNGMPTVGLLVSAAAIRARGEE